MFREVGPDLDISITTNGLLLDRLAAPLAAAGVDRATVSCDSLLRHRFAEMTRRDALDRVLEGLRAAEAAGLTPIKINTVVIGGTNDDEVVEFAALVARDRLRGPVHRVHAARRAARVGAGQGRAAAHGS